MKDVMFNGYHLPTVVRLAREAGIEPDSQFAWVLWRLSNAETLPVELAKEMMIQAGFVPFAGYPLVRRA
jgi:hypothetical protein